VPADRPRGSRRAPAVVAVVFLDLVGFGAVVPVLPFYFRSFAGQRRVHRAVAASYSLAQFVAAPVLLAPVAVVAVRVGRRSA
jgi:hypothetical protein